MLKKLALVSAISAISAGAFAMEAMDDESMAQTTGQDGITINIVPDRITRLEATAMGVTDATQSAIGDLDNDPLTVDPAPAFKGLSIGEIRVHDDDGYSRAAIDLNSDGDTSDAGEAAISLKNSGALVIGGGRAAIDFNADGDTTDAGEAAITALSDRTVILAKGNKPIQINIDMIGDVDNVKAGNQASLRVEIKQPQLAIKLGNIYVADSNAAADDIDAAGGASVDGDLLDNQDGTTVSDKVKILSGLEVVMGESTMIIQLGNEDSSNHMIDASATLAGGLTINNFELFDEFGAVAGNADNLLSGDVGSGGSIRAKSIKITDNGGTDLTTKTYIDVGSRVLSSTVTAGATSAYQADVVLKLQDPITASATSGAYLTYAALTDAADGADNILDNADDDAVATATLNAVNTGVNAQASGIATYASGLATTTSGAAGTWGGADTYNGLVITSQLGGVNGADITITNLALGDSNASVMGDVQILGLKLGASKIVIMGH